MILLPSFTFNLEGIAIVLILGCYYQLSYIYIKVFQAGVTAAIFSEKWAKDLLCSSYLPRIFIFVHIRQLGVWLLSKHTLFYKRD